MFVANLLQSLTVKDFWKSVNISGSYGQEFSALIFFDSQCILCWVGRKTTTQSYVCVSVYLYQQWRASSDRRDVASTPRSLRVCTSLTLSELFWVDARLQPAHGSTAEAFPGTRRDLPTGSQGHNNNNMHAHTHTHTHLTALCPGLLGWATTRKVKPIWILLKQETVSGSGISWAICKSAPRSRKITMPAPHHSVFYRPDALPATQPTVSEHWRHNNNNDINTYC